MRQSRSLALVLAFACSALALVPAPPLQAKETTQAQSQDTELARFAARYAEAWSSQDPDRVAAFFALDGKLAINGDTPAEGRKEIAEAARGFMEAFPDLVVIFDRLERRGDRVLFHWTLTGTNTGPGGTGAAVRISGFEAWLIGSDALISDSAGSFDAGDYARQLAQETSSLWTGNEGSDAVSQSVVKDDQINYLTGDPATWPTELEATTAAPDNHKILLENENVRVLEVTLGPGKVEPVHFHRWPSVLYIQQADEWIDRDAEGNVIFDSRQGPPLQLPLTMWKGPEAPHSPVNLSDSVEIRLIRVEIKTPIVTSKGSPEFSLFPANRTLTHAEDGAVLPDGRLLVGDWDHGLITLDPDGTKRPFGDFASAGFRTKPDPLWNSPNGISWEPDGRHVLVADITGGHIYRVDTQTEAVRRIYDHPFGVNSVVRDPSGAIWFTQSTENAAGEGSEARMFAAADKPLGDGSVWRIAPEEVGKTNPQPVKVVEGLDFANGIVFDAARGRLYVNEIVANRILSFAVDAETGALSDRRVLTTLPTPDNIELDANGDLWVTSPFANTVYKVDPDTGDRTTVFAPTPEASGRIISEYYRRLDAGEPILSLLSPEMWGPMPGLLTGIILSPDGAVYVSGLGDALVKLSGDRTGHPLGQSDLTSILDNRTRVIIEGIRSGDVSEIMALYGSGSLYAADNATLLSDPQAIEAFWVNVAASPAHDATLEVLKIERLGPDAFVEIQKYDVFDAVGERMFGGYASLLWRRVEGRWIIAADVSN